MHTVVIVIAKYFIVIPVVMVGLLWLRQTRATKKQLVVAAVVGGLAALLLSRIGSWLYYNPRPFAVSHVAPYFAHGNNNGFPSDHTLFTTFLAVIALRYSRTYGSIMLGVAGLVGASRVVAGVHHTIDIIGAMLIAAVGACIGLYVATRIVRQKPAKK